MYSRYWQIIIDALLQVKLKVGTLYGEGICLIVVLRPIVFLWDLGLQGECPPWGVFLRDPCQCLREFQEKPKKTPNCMERGQKNYTDL